MTEVNFRNIRKHGTSQEDGFEELCCQIFSLIPPSAEAKFVRKRGAGGDGGVEAYWMLPNGDEHALQAKYFFELEQPQRGQLSKAVAAMVKKHPRCTRYVICLPFNLGEQRQANKWSQKRHWDNLLSQWKKLDPERTIEFELWDETKIGTFLTDDKPEFNGRRHYWFDDKVLNHKWFQNRLAEAIKNLGERYTPDMNVDLPLAKTLGALRQSKAFWSELADLPELPTLSTNDASAKRTANTITEKISGASSLIQDAAEKKLIDGEIKRSSELISQALEEVQKNIGLLGGEEKSRGAYFKFYHDIRSYEHHLKESKVEFAVSPSILLLGDAGVGKSHILADAAQEAVDEGHPAILLLGQQLRAGNPWNFILSALGLEGNAEDFLGALDACAQAHGCRALLAIDAINEGNGKLIWPDELPGFVERVKRFPHLVLVVSCRTSYQRRITLNLVPDQMRELRHYGFRGHEEAAAAVYMDRNGISRPDTPILDPEFSNPLFLKTVCQALNRKKESSFPKGLRGVTRIFEFYILSVSGAIETRLDLDPTQKLVQRAVDSMIEEMLSQNEDFISAQRAIELTERILSSNGSEERNLLFQIKSEGVLADDIVYENEHDNFGTEIVRVSYERFLDHFRAREFIQKHVDPTALPSAFSINGPFRRLLGERIHNKVGLIEALSIQIPERYGIELFGLIEFDKAEKRSNQLHHYLREGFKESLYWRDPKKTNKDTIDHVNKLLGGRGPESFEVIIRCATSPEHLLNAELLHRNLMPIERADRDALWSTWISQNWYAPSEDGSSPLWALVDWAWSVDLTALEEKRIYLTCLALAWLFTSPRRSLRDRATKAMTAIVGSRIDIIRKLLLKFDAIDDFYVLERIYAVAYSVALAAKPNKLKALARTVINRAFRSKGNYDHILLRDYANGIVQRANQLSVLPSGFTIEDAKFLRGGPFPLEDILPSEIEDMKETVGSAYWSTMGGDFGTYVMNDVFHFSPTPLSADQPQTWEEITADFLADVIKQKPEVGNLFELYLLALKVEHEESEKRFRADAGPIRILVVSPDGSEEPHDKAQLSDDYSKEAHDAAKESLESARKALTSKFDEKEKEIWRWLNQGRGGRGLAKFSRRMAKRWVVHRVHQLGWTKERFEDFERYGAHNAGRMEHSAERIGKKYQWIAYHEFLAKLASHNYYLNGFEEKPTVLSGAWQLSRRDIDPSLLLKGRSKKLIPEQAWWTTGLPDVTEEHSFDQAHEWIRDCKDLQSDRDGLLQSNLNTNQKFYVLETYYTAKQKRIDLNSNRRSYSKSISTAVIQAAAFDALATALRGRKISGFFQNPQEYSADGFIGEYPWYESWYPIHDFFVEADDHGNLPKGLKVHYPVRNYYCEATGYDQSIEDTISIALPSGHLVEALGLEFDRYNPAAWNKDGKLIFCDPAVETTQQASGLIDLPTFSKWLTENEYIAVSAITAFKQYYQARSEDRLPGELMDCQLSAFDGERFRGERWTLLTELGPTDSFVREPFKMTVTSL